MVEHVMAMSLLLVALLVASAAFSGSETAFTSLSAAQLHELGQSGRAGRRVWTMCQRTTRLIVAILIGNNLANNALTVVATALVVDWIRLAGGNPSAHLWELTLALTLLLLIVGEITPKVLARARPRYFARLVSLPLRLWEIVVWVPAALLEGLARGLGRLVGLRGQAASEAGGRRELAMLIDLSRDLGLLGDKDHELMQRILRRGRTRLSDLVVHRTRVIYASVRQAPTEIMELLDRSRFSRLPIVQDDLDNPLGVLHVKDLASQLLKTPGQADVRPLLQPPVFIPSAATVGQALGQLQEARQHMAFVVDEHGGVEGIVTLEDLIEQITGSIADEHDAIKERFPRRRGGPRRPK